MGMGSPELNSLAYGPFQFGTVAGRAVAGHRCADRPLYQVSRSGRSPASSMSARARSSDASALSANWSMRRIETERSSEGPLIKKPRRFRAGELRETNGPRHPGGRDIGAER